MGKLIIVSAPSGAGKSTIVARLLAEFPRIEFSVSATSRPPRGKEKDGVEYYFLSPDEFRRRISEDDFIEWEEVYEGRYYGTLRNELERIWSKGHAIIFDIDVKGALNLKKIFGSDALSIFIMPPSVKELRSRLTHRGTDSDEEIHRRIAKAEIELADAPNFDVTIINDNLHEAVERTKNKISEFLG